MENAKSLLKKPHSLSENSTDEAWLSPKHLSFSNTLLPLYISFHYIKFSYPTKCHTATELPDSYLSY